MEVKFASNKKGPSAPKKEPEKPAAAAPAAAAPPAQSASGEEQFKKLMPIAIIGLLIIAGVLVYIARKGSSSSAVAPDGRKIATKGGNAKPTGGFLNRLKKPRAPQVRKPTAAGAMSGWRNKLFARRTPPVRGAAPSPRIAVAARRRRNARRTAAAPAPTPTAPRAAAPSFCLIFGSVKPSNKALAQSDIGKMAKKMRGLMWPAKLRLKTKPCCKVVLGPYPKAKRQKAIGHFNKLKQHYRGLSLSEYNGLLDEIFPPGLGWETCP